MDKPGFSALRENEAAEGFRRISDLLIERLDRAEYAGWDPFDALNSRVFNATPLSLVPWARLAWTQAFKRNPVNMRGLAAVPKTANAVTLALAMEIHRRDGELVRAKSLVEKLLTMSVQCKGAPGAGWGYPFAWQARAFYVPAGEPNIIATAYAVRELVHWKKWPGIAAEEAIVAAAELVAARFIRRRAAGRSYVAYVGSSDAMVHNASLWGAYVLAEAARIDGKPEWHEVAAAAADYSVSAQRADGSWPYGEASHHQFTDGFHTGYVLEALHHINGLSQVSSAQAAIGKGLAYYQSNLMEADGTAKYYSTARYPIDANCAAQFVITLDRLGWRHDIACAVLRKVIDHLWLETAGHFAYQRGAKSINSIEYPRWTQIWMALALRIAAARTADAPSDSPLQQVALRHDLQQHDGE